MQKEKGQGKVPNSKTPSAKQAPTTESAGRLQQQDASGCNSSPAGCCCGKPTAQKKKDVPKPSCNCSGGGCSHK